MHVIIKSVLVVSRHFAPVDCSYRCRLLRTLSFLERQPCRLSVASCRCQRQVFVEVHYHHEEMAKYGWTADKPNLRHTLAQAQALIERVRDKGVFIHAWP
jgi:hypothetical protein